MVKVKNQNILIQKNKGSVMKKPNKNVKEGNNPNIKQSGVMNLKKSDKFGGIKKNFAEKNKLKKISKPDVKKLIKEVGKDASNNPILAKVKKPHQLHGKNVKNGNAAADKIGPQPKPFAKKEFPPKGGPTKQQGYPKKQQGSPQKQQGSPQKQQGSPQKGGVKQGVPKQGVPKHNTPKPDAGKQVAPKPNKDIKTNGSQPKNEDTSKPKKEGKNKKEKTLPLPNAPKFDEAKFNGIVNSEKIKKIVLGLQAQFKTEAEKMKTKKIFDDYNYVMNVTCFKIPNCPKRMVKFLLTHSLVSDDDDVCLITKDLHRGLRVDYEPTKQHFDDLLKEKGVTRAITVVPFNQIKKEYSTYELKGKLANTYDAFLCDAKIIGHVVGFLGKKFRKSRHTPYAIRLGAADLNGEIKKILGKTSYYQGQKGTMIGIPVATNKMSVEQITENILSVVSHLRSAYPGGMENVRNMYIKVNIGGTSSLPLYISMCQPPTETPNVIGIRQEKMTKQKEKANKILSKFELTSSGNVLPNKNNTTKKRPHEDENLVEENINKKNIKKSKVEPVKNEPKQVKKKEEKSKPVNSKEKPKNLIKLQNMSDSSDSGDEEYKVCQSDTASEQLIEEPSDDEAQNSGPRPLVLRQQPDSDEDDDDDDDNDDEEDNDDNDDDDDDDDDNSDDDNDAIDDDEDDDSDAGSELEFEGDSDEIIENGLNTDSDDDDDDKDEDVNEGPDEDDSD